MKKLLLPLILIIAFSPVYSQVDNYDLLTKNIESSNIKSITKLRETKMFPNGEKNFKITFNQKGQLISIEEYEYLTPDYPLVMRQEINYDEEGKKVSTHINAPDGSRAIDTLIYNDNGILIKKQRIAKGEIVKSWDYSDKNKNEHKKEFDDNGNLVKLTEPNGDYTIYKYDSNNNLIEELEYNDGEKFIKYEYQYDKRDLLTKMKTYLIYIGDGMNDPLIYYFEYEEFK